MMKIDATGCIVLYKNDREMLLKAINSFLNTSLNIELFLIDNSPNDDLKNIIVDNRVVYLHNPSNPGFGAAHNIAIRKAFESSDYHLVLNPDIYYDKGILEMIVKYMDSHSEVGVIMPKILYPNGDIQYLAKLLPTPFDFIIRRFIPVASIKKRMSNKFELRNSNYNKIIDVPYLSGCFMVFRTEVLNKINGFDENIFMHTEDIDICRRVILSGYHSVFYPQVSVYHDHEKKTFLNLKTFKIYLKSAIYYFNKWGWFFDQNRKEINKRTLSQF